MDLGLTTLDEPKYTTFQVQAVDNYQSEYTIHHTEMHAPFSKARTTAFKVTLLKASKYVL